jgi:hypothetical protein
MKIREANINDKNRGDSFVDSEGGDYRLYYIGSNSVKREVTNLSPSRSKMIHPN